MTSRRTECADAVREIANRVGADLVLGHTSRHQVAHLTFNGQTKRLSFPGSPSDGNAYRAVGRDAVKLLRSMGADI